MTQGSLASRVSSWVSGSGGDSDSIRWRVTEEDVNPWLLHAQTCTPLYRHTPKVALVLPARADASLSGDLSGSPGAGKRPGAAGRERP